MPRAQWMCVWEVSRYNQAEGRRTPDSPDLFMTLSSARCQRQLFFLLPSSPWIAFCSVFSLVSTHLNPSSLLSPWFVSWPLFKFLLLPSTPSMVPSPSPLRALQSSLVLPLYDVPQLLHPSIFSSSSQHFMHQFRVGLLVLFLSLSILSPLRSCRPQPRLSRITVWWGVIDYSLPSRMRLQLSLSPTPLCLSTRGHECLWDFRCFHFRLLQYFSGRNVFLQADGSDVTSVLQFYLIFCIQCVYF